MVKKKYVRVTNYLHEEGDSKFLKIYPQEGSIKFLCKHIYIYNFYKFGILLHQKDFNEYGLL